MQILGVRRAHRFSPNSVVRDAEIFNAVVSLLESYDHSVVAVDEDTLRYNKIFFFQFVQLTKISLIANFARFLL